MANGNFRLQSNLPRVVTAIIDKGSEKTGRRIASLLENQASRLRAAFGATRYSKPSRSKEALESRVSATTGSTVQSDTTPI